MKSITYTAFQKTLSAKKLAKVYFISGEESYLIDSCVEKIEEAVEADSLNREVFHAPDIFAADIVNAVETLPFLSEKRIVVVKAANKLKNEEYESIKKLIENPVDTSCLVLIFPENAKKTKSKRKDLFLLCEKADDVVCVDCKKVYEKDVKIFIQNEFKNRNKIIPYELIQQMINDSGMDLLNISNEIEKICVYTGYKKEITTEDFSKISGFTKDINVFMFTEYLEKKDIKNALFIFEKMLANGESAINILFAIAGSVRKVLIVKSAMEEKNMSEYAAMNLAKIPDYSFIRQKFAAGLSKYSLSHLKKSMQAILKADISIKTGKTTPESAVEELIMFVCR